MVEQQILDTFLRTWPSMPRMREGTLVAFRWRLIEGQMNRRLIERTIEISEGRCVSIYPDEALLVELRQAQQTPEGRHKLRERVAVEHTLVHIG